MNLSKYVTYLLRNKEVTVIEGGKELVNAIYDLNNTLNQCSNNSAIPVKK